MIDLNQELCQDWVILLKWNLGIECQKESQSESQVGHQLSRDDDVFDEEEPPISTIAATEAQGAPNVDEAANGLATDVHWDSIEGVDADAKLDAIVAVKADAAPIQLESIKGDLAGLKFFSQFY